MIRLTKHTVMAMQSDLIDRTGGEHGLRDEGLLESALELPFISFFGLDPYPSVIAKAARLAFGLTRNHAFVDGNKRIGILVMISFLRLNDMLIKATDEELIELGLSIANKAYDINDISRWIKRHRI